MTTTPMRRTAVVVQHEERRRPLSLCVLRWTIDRGWRSSPRFWDADTVNVVLFPYDLLGGDHQLVQSENDAECGGDPDGECPDIAAQRKELL